MNIADQVNFEGLLDIPMPEEMRPFAKALVARFEAYKLRLVFQLRKEPTVFYADPDNEPEKILGYKTGDVAFWVDSTGTDQYRILT